MFAKIKLFNQLIGKYKNLGVIDNPYLYFFKWKKSLKNGSNSIDDELPWITFNVIDYLGKYITPDSVVFEFGGGGSTLFFLKHQATVYTVEHDGVWYQKLALIVKEKNYMKWTGFFIEAQQGNIVPTPSISNPLDYSTDDETYKNHYFKKYSTKIDDFDNDFFDVVLVDGRSRPSCIYHSLKKIKKGGLLILDNSDRAYYLEETKKDIEKEFTLVVSKYAPSPYYQDFTHTTIWKKNK